MERKKYRLAFSTYEDRILGAWLGKSIGGTVGAAFESHKELKHLEMDELWPETLPPNDDMDIQLVWLEVLQEVGCYPTSTDLIHFWQNRCWYNFCEYGAFLRNVQHGIMPPLSGSWNNDFFQESEGCPIRSDIWGLVAPGNIELAAHFAQMDGELDHSGFSIDAEIFYAAMTATALVEEDLSVILQSALTTLPAGSQIPAVLETMKKIAADIPDCKKAWQVTIRNFGNRDASKAITNFALMFLALFKSNDDFSEAMKLCCNFGWDVDCTCATLGAFLGAWKGTKCIPNEWRARLGQNLICGIEVKHKNSTIEALARDTAMAGLEMALCRNKCVELTGAPPLVPRRRLPEGPQLSVEYPSGPVLYAEKPTIVKLSAKNFTGKIMITPAPGTLCEPTAVENGGECVIRRCTPGLPLPEKNIFTVNLGGERKTFGLEGARQWLVYGPYWDMWKREKYGDVCAYARPGHYCHPGKTLDTIDSFQTYISPDFAYLDEKRLLREELPEEMPCRIECGDDTVKQEDVGGWFGPACWYFTREFIAPKGDKVAVGFGLNGFVKAWMDGKEVIPLRHLPCWCSTCCYDGICFIGTGKPVRLVFKICCPEDAFKFSVAFFRDEPLPQRAGISYFAEGIENIPSLGGLCS